MRWLIAGAGLLITLFGLKKWTDMIRQQAYDKALEETALEKQRFLQRLDHELKNPLTAMQIALANLEDTTDLEARREIRAGMRGQILRLSHLISDLRKLASLGKSAIERIPVDVGELLAEVMLVFRDGDLATRRRFISDYNAAALPSLVGDRDLLQLAIYNLMDNACKFTRDGDTITLRATVEDEQLIIAVSDTGRGIPAGDVAHVWEDLYRSPDVQGIPGSGVGLAMVKGIVEQHDGSVMIDSEFGQGTTVTLTLPI